ncbi:MAG: ATP-binding protein [Chloroflexota bacterium]
MLLLLGTIVFLNFRWRGLNNVATRRQRNLLIFLLIFAPLAGLFVGIGLPPGSSLLPPEVTSGPVEPIAMLFLALPWVLAGGMFGPASATLAALLSGLPLVLFRAYNLYTPLGYALLAVLFSAAMRQRYRTPTYKWLRHPLVTALGLVLLYPPLYLTFAILNSRGALASRLDYAISNLPGFTLAFAIEMLLAAIFAEVLTRLVPASWGSRGRLLPSPAESSLRTRFILSLAPLGIILVLTLVIGDWVAAGQAARSMLEKRMKNAAETAAANVPYFLEAGQSLIVQLAEDTRLLSQDRGELSQALEEDIKAVPFFNQLTVFDTQASLSDPLVSYPTAYNIGNQAPIEEQFGMMLALEGVTSQIFTIQPVAGQTTAQISFVAAIFDGDQPIQRILIGRTDLSSNPFSGPIILSLNSLKEDNGQGMLLDADGRILAHSITEQVMGTYSGQTPGENPFFDDTAPDGTRQLVYYLPVETRPWTVVITVPAQRAQQLAIDIALPLLGIVVILTLVAIFISRLSLRMISDSLHTLTLEAGRLSQGQLDKSLPLEGEDEVGQLRHAFEQMRLSLKARLDELNRLLLVSQGVASSLEVSEAVQPVLESALSTGASMARVVLTPAVVPELDGDTTTPLHFGLGPGRDLYHELDEQILALTRQQDRLVLPNLSRPRLLQTTPGVTRPASIMAVALRHENLYYGTLWLAYTQPHTFSEEEVRFLTTLGSQAALAAANARLFLNAEIGRQRLASILASSPDPILVTDQRDRLLLANPAAWQVLGLGMHTDEGQPIDQVISQAELVDLLRSSSAEHLSSEVTLPDGRIYLATATPVLAEGQRMGRVCVLRDVTHFKELDALKSDFVSTVSHDLRSPLTLMRGYATMLEMVGQLNEQQTSYVQKIISGVESMSRLVNNLLDLGRIDAGVGLQLEMIPIHDVIERVVGAQQLPAAQKQIQLTSEIPKHTIPLIEADQALLQQALQNLVENAIKYTRPGGKVHVRVQVQSSGMVFEVIDNGVGISPMDQPRLFEKFYRGAQQKGQDQRGTGLGLAIVKSIADRHGGRVWADSQLGKGSVFHFTIPLRQPREDRET